MENNIDLSNMTPISFSSHVECWQEDERSTLDSKGTEYTNQDKSAADSRLSNFYTAAKLYDLVHTDTLPATIYKTMVKHLAWWVDTINSDIQPTPEKIREHMKDIHNYLYLMEYAWILTQHR